jgi:hypothetical protein
MAIIAVVIALVTGIIGFVIVDTVESQQTWNLTLSGTIAQYIVPIGLLGLLAAAAYMAVAR